MKLKGVDIDSDSGFCAGVIKAIGAAEHFLAEHNSRPLYSLGAIVHNEQELARLQSGGLVTVKDPSEVPAGSVTLIRAHGEPPKTYATAAQRGLNVIDCTCPVVLNLQKAIKNSYLRVKEHGGTVVIFGKIGHAEVLGLVGQTDGNAVVVQSGEMLAEAIGQGRINSPVEIFSQTTMSPDVYKEICSVLQSRFPEVRVHNSICAQVERRHSRLAEFARKHDVVIFVAGHDSSNGKVLYELCRSVNPRSYKIASAEELDVKWFAAQDLVGVCGATSTPQWLLRKVAESISDMLNNQ